MIKLVIDLLCGACFSVGGHGVLWLRRYLMPFLLAIGISILSGVWWLGITVIPSIGTLCLGYFGKGFFGRGSWLLLQAVLLGLGTIFFHHLAWYFYAPYILGAFLLGGLLYDIPQVIGDIIFGCWLGSILFLIH